MKMTMSTLSSTSHCNIDFPASPSWFRAIRQLVSTTCTQCGFPDRDAGQVAMAVDEAMSNIFRHGYKGDPTGRIALYLLAENCPEPKISITIKDNADQVDIELIQSRDLSDVRPGGIGVHLIQTVMDKALWEKRNNGGMILSMSKSIQKYCSKSSEESSQING